MIQFWSCAKTESKVIVSIVSDMLKKRETQLYSKESIDLPNQGIVSIFFFIYMDVLLACTSVYHSHAWCLWREKRVWDSLELELQMVVQIASPNGAM